MDGRIPIKQVGGGKSEIGSNYNQSATSATTTPGSWQDIIDVTVPTGKKVYLLQAYLTCRQPGKVEIWRDSDIIGSGRTASGSPNFVFFWSPYEEADASMNIKIKFVAMAGCPAVDVEAYLHARITDI